MDIKSLVNTVKKSELFGDSRYGKAFDDLDFCSEKGLPDPKSIIIRKGAIIDNLAFAYNGFTAAHGGTGGGKSESMLEKDEYIVKAAGTYDKYANELLIESLAFTTNKGNVIPACGPVPGKNYFEYQAENGYAIFALHGRSDRYLNCIGFYSKKTDFDIKDDLLGGLLG